MLQKIEDITTEQFLRDVDSLKLKFPGAKISKGTGYDKSTVSKYLNGGEEPSASFLKAFYEWVQQSGKKVENVDFVQVQPALITSDKAIEMLENQIADMKAHIKTLQNETALLHRINETNLNEIRSNQAGIIMMLKETIQRAAVYRYGTDKKKLEAELQEINKIIGAALK